MAIDDAVTSRSALRVARLDFPYRREGRRAPDRAPKLMASLREEVERLCGSWGSGPEHLVLGGRSMGGRIASMVVAGADGEPPLPVAGLVLMSYPLHPPGKPDRLRVEHLRSIRVPVLSISGDRDAFGTPEELAAALDVVAGPVTTVTIHGAGHDLKRRDDEVVAATLGWLGVTGRG